MIRRWLSFAFLLVTLLGCATTMVGCAARAPFATTFPQGGSKLDEALARAHRGGQVSLPPMIVGVTDAPRGVFGYDLGARKVLFREPAQVVAMPFIAGDLTVVPEATRVTIRRLRDGAVVKELPLDGMHLVGADGDGKISVVVMSTGGSMNVRSRVLILRGEKVQVDRTVERALGAPAVMGGLAFVPNQRVFVSILDPKEGEELARVHIKEDVAGHAFRHRGDVYFGQHGIYLLDKLTERGPAEGAHYWKFAPVRTLPGSPPLFPDSSAPPPPIESALYRVCLSVLPEMTAQGQLSLQDDSLYLAFYRHLFSLAPDASAAHWAYETETDIVGIRAVPGGLISLETKGVLTEIDTSGQVTLELEIGVRPIAARIRADRLEGTAKREALPLATQLNNAARSGDTRLVPSRAFAAELLTPVEGDRAAEALIELCVDRDSPPRVREAACQSLSERKQPSDAVIAALGKRANYLERVELPPIGALAQAAQHAGDKRAAPLLTAQLFDPALPLSDVAHVFRALAEIGDASSARALSDFLRLYHAEANDEEYERTLVIGMDALAKLDPEVARTTFAAIASDPLGRSGVRVAAEQRLQALGPTAEQAAEAAEAAQRAQANSESAGTPEAEQGPPAHLTSKHLEDALAPVRLKLSRCVREAPEHPASARLVLVIEGDGKVSDVRALPASTQACARELVSQVTFPATKFGRRTVMSYSVSR